MECSRSQLGNIGKAANALGQANVSGSVRTFREVRVVKPNINAVNVKVKPRFPERVSLDAVLFALEEDHGTDHADHQRHRNE